MLLISQKLPEFKLYLQFAPTVQPAFGWTAKLNNVRAHRPSYKNSNPEQHITKKNSTSFPDH